MDRSGQTLGKYKLIRRLGKGGMAEVYLANQPTIERQVAIKVLHRHLSEDENFIERFKREARSLGQLQHPNIVNIIDFDHAGDVYFMVMDYIGGPTLSDYLDVKNTLDNEHALTILAQLLQGLSYAHQKGAVHRDIKPANVMFTDQSCQQAVVTDFGITRLMNDQTLTLEGSVIGTPAYMSPEAVIGEKVDGRADIYSLGVMLYEMVTGRTPFEGATPLSLVIQQVNEPLPSPLQFQPHLPPAMVDLIEASLAKDINHRFQTCVDFLNAIQATQKTLNLPVSASPMAHATVQALPTAEPEPTTIEQALPNVQAEPTTREQTAPKHKVNSVPPTEDTHELATHSKSNRTPIVIGGVLVLLLLVGAGIFTSRQWDKTFSVEPADTVAASTIPPIEPNRTGTLQLSAADSENLNTIQLQVERVPLPPANSHYELWLVGTSGTPLNIGSIPFAANQLNFTDQVDQSISADLSRLLITLESDDTTLTEPTTPVFTGELTAEIQSRLQQLFLAEPSGRLPATVTQMALAQQHFQFAQDALVEGNFAEIKRHTEHVVNILDGDSGTFFGDLNLDGQTQNPGDDVGVRVYLSQSRDLLTEIDTAEPMTAERQYWVSESVAAAETALNTLDTVLQRAAAITSTDSTAEAEPIANEVAQLVDMLSLQIATVTQQALTLVQIPIQNTIKNLPAPAPLVDRQSGQFGLFELSNNPANGFTIQYRLRIAQLPPPVAGQFYQAWLNNTNSGHSHPLGQLNYQRGQADLRGKFPEISLTAFDQIIIALATGTENVTPLSDSIILRGQFSTSISKTVSNLLSPEVDGRAKGALFGITDQLRLAIQHHGFAMEALAADDLAKVKVHTEHQINILDGRSGSFFGDLNGDGQAQNPGDGVGIRAYWVQTADALTALELTSNNQQFTRDQLLAVTQNNLAIIKLACEQASKIFASDTIAEAQPFLDTVHEQLLALVKGRDLDNSNTIDPLTGEGGIQMTQAFIIQLNEVPLIKE